MYITNGKNVEETQVDNNEISINYTMTGKRWNRTDVVVDNIFAYKAHNIIQENEDSSLTLWTNVVIERIDPSRKKPSKQN